ncbi:MAG: hypothetical protein NTY36_05510 [Deltaproteobacteria bacterium]|nr:hypothetical protein [Deltaproteobacteria bacterium]
MAFIVLLTFVVPTFTGCGAATSVKNWVTGNPTSEEDEETVPAEAQQETVMIDGKPYVRSKNPYWLTYPEQPEYLYVEKGREFKGMQQRLVDAISKAVGKEKDKGAKTLPPDKLQELVKAEVDRILREQGMGGFVSQGRGEKAPYVGRSVAVIPDLDTPTSYEGLNRTLAIALGDAAGRTKDLRVVGQDQVREALGKAGINGKLSLSPNIKALGDYLGVQGIVLTGIMPPEKGSQAAMVMQVYDTFMGTKEQSIAGTVETGPLNAEAVTKFANANALRVGGELINIRWFGRVEFVKEGKTYLNLGQNAGVKVGDRLKVVAPGKEVVNPTTHAVLGYTSDESQGELKVTELLGNTGAVATPTSGGPFKPNERVRAAK